VALTGDQIAGSIGVSLMALVLIQRLGTRQIPMGTVIRMALIWFAIILVAIATVWLLQPYLHGYLT
jgi:hypothetical protein